MDKEEKKTIKEEVKETKKEHKCDEKECHCQNKEKYKKAKPNKELEKLKEENEKLNDKLLRTSAELSNIVRRSSLEREQLLKYEGENVIKKILPIIDDFDRAIQMDTTEDEKFIGGFKLIYANLLKLLEEIDVKEIDCLGKEFDPYKMEAVLRESIIEEEPNVVLTVLQKGYTYKDKVIRHAMVKVNE